MKSGRPKIGDMVVLKRPPEGLLDDLPKEDRVAIGEMIGKSVRLAGYDGEGRAELEFTDYHGIIHFIYVRPNAVGWTTE